jgi:hypothetical protein
VFHWYFFLLEVPRIFTVRLFGFHKSHLNTHCRSSSNPTTFLLLLLSPSSYFFLFFPALHLPPIFGLHPHLFFFFFHFLITSANKKRRDWKERFKTTFFLFLQIHPYFYSTSTFVGFTLEFRLTHHSLFKETMASSFFFFFVFFFLFPCPSCSQTCSTDLQTEVPSECQPLLLSPFFIPPQSFNITRDYITKQGTIATLTLTTTENSCRSVRTSLQLPFFPSFPGSFFLFLRFILLSSSLFVSSPFS